MTTDQNLILYTKFAGFRLVVLANRFGCDSDFSRELHDRLVEGLDAAIDRISVIMELERSVLIGEDELPNISWRARSRFSGASLSICWTNSKLITTRMNSASTAAIG
ncbi:hypothetical protein RHE_PD00164 (plasmid) [Rhizobium etli CFN 42]|uniref:Uncharacterized protein n=1 Tax=Rhizobium etli (strain ATCC 51251 / DSM 11541 / JCM 21823 / NBRC 15573 / CFN 42) TaxID=347834 RepID=Q8KL65_RHIEC|nr:hypothetical protein RHE_PD00164 [Rhizobium etli CFN 42]